MTFESKKHRGLLVAAALVALAAASTGRDDTFSDTAIKKAIPREAASDGVGLRPDTTDKRTLSVMKKVFKDIRRRSCRQAPRTTPPSTSWPARSENAISICS